MTGFLATREVEILHYRGRDHARLRRARRPGTEPSPPSFGNAVPSPAAAAIASVMGQTLLLAWSGQTFVLSATPIWVRELAIGLAVDLPA